MPRRNDHRPVDDEERANIIADMRTDMPRNAIARKYNRSGWTISNIAESIGFEFDRSHTALAIAARDLDIAAAQQTLARSFLIRAQEALDRIDEPTDVLHDGIVHTVTPSAGDQRNLMTVAAIGSQRARDILASGAGDDQVAARSLMTGLRDGITQILDRPLPADEDPTRMPD
jgi:hypothetical protein